eukprot:gene8579-11000_t
MVRENGRSLHQKLPDIYPDSLMPLLHPIQYPLASFAAITPLLYCLAIYCLLMFFFLSKGEIGGIFGKDNALYLRLAGVFIGIGVASDMIQPLIFHWLTPGTSWGKQSMSEIYVLLFVSGTLTTLSKNGNILFRHARKLRDDLDEIV